MILSFINIRKVPREVLRTSGFALCFQHFPRDIANVNEWKIMFGPTIENEFDVYIICKSNNTEYVYCFVLICTIYLELVIQITILNLYKCTLECRC